MTKIGDNAADCISGIEATVKRDLDELLETNTTVSFYASDDETIPLSFEGYDDVGGIANLDEIDFTSFKSDANQLEKQENSKSEELRYTSNLLRSNCRVTNQPDWGDVFIRMYGKDLPTAESLAKYIVSHRTVSHFHEEICEMIFAHLTEAFKPEQLMVACLYTRRGGIDINPIRATHQSLIPEFFTKTEYTIQKTLRQ
jgi:7-cyano-7-deazaguanine reductase